MKNSITMRELAPMPSLFSEFEHICDSFTQYLNFERSPVDVGEYKLERMQLLLARCGNPEQLQQFVHIAGSKGKGSTAIILHKLLSAHGYRVGLFTSPHILHYRERFHVSNVDPHRYATTLVSTARDVAELAKEFAENANPPTMFELLTLIAFLLFAQLSCDISVIETGLGGRLDTTNVIQPQLSIITHLELEHTAILGTTLAHIAKEKAGIIKPSVPVIIAPQEKSAYAVLKQKVQQEESDIYYTPNLADYSQHTLHKTGMDVHLSIDGQQIFSQKNQRFCLQRKHSKDSTPLPKAMLQYRFHVPLVDPTQLENICSALVCTLLLIENPSDDLLSSALGSVQLPGRMQKIDAATYLDGAHTADSITACLTTMSALYPAGFVLVLACVQGKNCQSIVSRIAECSAIRALIITDPAIRPSASQTIINICTDMHLPHTVIPDACSALNKARTWNLPILCTGSFFLLTALQSHPSLKNKL